MMMKADVVIDVDKSLKNLYMQLLEELIKYLRLQNEKLRQESKKHG